MQEGHRRITDLSLLPVIPRKRDTRRVPEGHPHPVPVQWVERIPPSLIPDIRREPRLLEEGKAASFRTGVPALS